ncbi:MAG: glucose-6-phosphate dehydrogenase assembly protein OpcA [Thermomicrobiales bacterium]|nr:glucose-6-phosphate dehydrogenase assembly protein OpcA [Thermomicrobiales bacterium]
MMTGVAAIGGADQKLFTGWTADSVEVTRIRAELSELWRSWATLHGAPSGDILPGDREQVFMRPSTVNVIAVTETIEEAQRTAELLLSLPDYSPSRSIVLARHGAGGGQPFAVQLFVDERVLHRSSSPTRIEVIVISAPPGHDEALASIATTLLVPDLPDVLYVPFEPVAPNPLLHNLRESCDGILVDTVSARDAGASLEFLRACASIRNTLGLGDLVWTRLRTWRDLIAQFYDQPAALASLEFITDVQIVHAASGPDVRSGRTAALLIAGWLASRLGWRTPGELIPTGTGYRLTLRSGGRGKSREVLLHISEGTSDFSCASLERVTLTATGDQASTFSVERVGESAIMTSSSTPHVPDMTRLVHSSCPPDNVILAAKLRRLRIDPVYRDALEIAATLWPEGFDL